MITPEPTPPAPVINDGTSTTDPTKKKSGTSALRINLTLPTASATGLNIPVA